MNLYKVYFTDRKSLKIKKIKLFMLFLVYNLIFSAIIAPLIIFWGPFESLKKIVVGSIATSRHPQVVNLFLSEKEIELIVNSNKTKDFIRSNVENKQVISDSKKGIIIEDIEGANFKGKVMIIEDSTRVKVAVTNEIGIAGERLSGLVIKNSAIAGINGGGFYDPDGKGNGAYPDGLTVKNGNIVHNNIGNKKVNVIGLDLKGQLVIGNMSVVDIKAKKIQEAVSFYPNLIIDGEPQILGDGGWGIAPRTGIGQRPDGSIIFVVIDGRQPTWSMGATLSDLMSVFIQYGAINAANLDGGSSTEMIYDGKILNRLWNIFGERYIPSAFVVMPD